MKKQALNQKLPLLVALLLLIQPLMDVFSFWLQELQLSTAPSLILRLGVLCIVLLCGFLVSDRKWIYFVTAGICAILAAGHIYACMQLPQGYTHPMADLMNFIRVVQTPLLAICLMTFLRQNDRCFLGLQWGITGALLIVLVVEVLCAITGTEHNTYTDGTGLIGWFSNTNSQSHNLCVLIPVSLIFLLTKKNRNLPLFWTVTVLGLFAFYLFGTRLAYLGLYATCVGLSFCIFLVRRKDWKVAVGLLLAAVVFTGLLPWSPMITHMKANGAIQDERQGYISQNIGEDMDEVQELIGQSHKPTKVTDPTAESEPEEEEGMTKDEHDRLVELLTPTYTHYVRDFVEIFGAEKTMEMYDYTIDVRDFASVRHKKLMFAEMLMQDSPVSSRIFGLNLDRFYVGENIYDVENDFHGIYYLYGWAGLAAYLLFILYFVALILYALFKDAKKYFTLEAASYGLALLLSMAHAYNTAGVLRRPNASVFLSALLAGIYYFVRVRNYDEVEAETL